MGSYFSTEAKLVLGKPVVLVVGGGFAGVQTAKHLDKTGNFNVVLIDRKDYFLHNIGSLRATVEPTFAYQICVPYNKLLVNGTVVQAEVTSIDPAQGVYVAGRDAPIKFDYLVIATGSSYAFPGKIAATDIESSYTRYREVHSLIQKATKIVIVGGGPVGVELAGEIATDFKGKKLTLIHSRPTLLPDNLNPELKSRVLQGLKDIGVDVWLNQKVHLDEEAEFERKDKDRLYLVGPTLVHTSAPASIQADLVFFCTGTRYNNRSFQQHMADNMTPEGRLRVKKTLQVQGFINVFALGDICNIGTSMAFYCEKQSEIVAHNISTLSAGKTELQEYPGDGHPAMIVPLGRNGGVSQFPTSAQGWVVGDFMTRKIKAAELFTPKFRQLLNQSAQAEGPVKTEKRKSISSNSQNEQKSAEHIKLTKVDDQTLTRAANLTGVIEVPLEQAVHLLRDGLPTPVHPSSQEHL